MFRHLLILTLAFAIAACQKDAGEGNAEKDQAAAPVAAASQTIVFERAGGGELAKIAIDGGNVTIALGGSTIEGKPDGSKRRYTQGGSLVAVVKSDGDKVKLKDDAGKLLWKIKLSDDKIKISDNEENANAYAIKPKDDGFKVKRDETDIGKVKLYPDEKRIKVKAADDSEKFAGKGDGSAAWAVLLLDDVPEPQRMVIAAEIALRGR